MRILIVGAGKVGSSVAGNLVSESNDITIVDTDKDRITDIQNNYDLQGIVGDATSPSVLAEAGAVDADMIIAVTANDETNLAVTLIAEQLFNVPSRIARVRNDELREYPALLSTAGVSCDFRYMAGRGDHELYCSADYLPGSAAGH